MWLLLHAKLTILCFLLNQCIVLNLCDSNDFQRPDTPDTPSFCKFNFRIPDLPLFKVVCDLLGKDLNFFFNLQFLPDKML